MTEIKARLNLDRLLTKYNLSQRKLAELTGIRAASINDMVHHRKENLNLDQLERIANILNIKDITEFIILEEVDKTE